jgi:hypothetical protein
MGGMEGERKIGDTSTDDNGANGANGISFELEDNESDESTVEPEDMVPCVQCGKSCGGIALNIVSMWGTHAHGSYSLNSKWHTYT